MFHPSFFSQTQQQPNGFAHLRPPMNFFGPSQSVFFRPTAPTSNQSTHNMNFNRDFERFPMPAHGFASMPSGGHPFFDYTNQQHPDPQRQRWRQNITRAKQQQQHRRTPAFHFQDKSTSYYMTDPIRTSDDRITIQLTKVHVGPNGDQQRVFVEQDFSNEGELDAFVRNLRSNFEQAFNNRSNNGSTTQEQAEDNGNTDSKKEGVVVVEEPDEEPKIYQQQAYNANIESKKAAAAAAAAAAASPITSPLTPTMESTPHPDTPMDSAQFEDQPPPSNRTTSNERHRRTFNRTRYVSPSAASRMSSTSTTRSYRRRRNKTKYRRQPMEHPINREEGQENQPQRNGPSKMFKTPSFSRRYQATPTPAGPRFQQRFSPTGIHAGAAPPSSQWRFNGYPPTAGRPPNHSRSFVPPTTNDRLPPRFSRVHHSTEPFFQSAAHQHAKQFRSPSAVFRPGPSPCPTKENQPKVVADHLQYPNHQQQQPRVHRTKSECHRPPRFTQQRSRSTTQQFQPFSPIQQPPIVQRRFVPFRSPPFLVTFTPATAPMFYPQQRTPFGSIQEQLGLFNSYRFGSTRF